MEIQDDFAELRVKEANCMGGAEATHQVTQYQQMRTISAIRHSQHESPDWEMAAWKLLSTYYDAEIEAIRKAQERCRVHGRPG